MAYYRHFDPRKAPSPYSAHRPPVPKHTYGFSGQRDTLSPSPQHQDHFDDQTRPQVPYHLQPDTRLPPPGTSYPDPVALVTDGYETHSLLLLSHGSKILTNLLDVATKKRSVTIQTVPEDLVERALDRKTLCHISDGPTGGIWIVSAGKEEIISCLVLELKGGWEVLGIGKGISEGDLFLRHPCGFGPDVEDEPEKGKPNDKGKAKVGKEGVNGNKGNEEVVNSKAWIKSREEKSRSREKAADEGYLKKRGMTDAVSRALVFRLTRMGVGSSRGGGGGGSGS